MKQKDCSKRSNPIQSLNKLKQDNVLLKSFDDFLGKYGLYFLFSLIALIIFFAFKDFLLLKKIYLFKDVGSDSENLVYPTFYSLADYITKEGIPKWSFNQGMGQNIFPVRLIDPFSLFIIFMRKSNVYYTMFYAEVFKIFCAGLFFYLFLKKIIVSNYTAIIGGVLYSFSGFMILGGQWTVFSTQAVYVALLLYAFEKLYQDNNWVLFPVSIFLIASNQPLDLYFIGFFLVIYIIFRLFEANEKDPKKVFALLTKLFFLGIMGVAMSSFFLINGLQIMLESPRVSGDVSYYNTLFSKHVLGFEGVEYGETHYLTALMRLFSCDILGTGNNFKGWFNYLEAPLFYCGLISLVLLPHFLSISDKRRKLIYFIFILVFIFPVIFPFFRYSFWLFTGNYYRIFSFFVALVVLLIGLKSFDNIDCKMETNIKIIIATLLMLLFFLYYPYQNAKIIDKNIRNIIAMFLIIYSVCIYLIQFKKIKNFIKLILLSVIVIELIYLSNATVNNRPVISGEETTQKVDYNDYTVDAVKFIKLNDKTFFRINKDYSSGMPCESSRQIGCNDALVQDFYGTPSYHSFNQLNYIKFLQELGIIKRKDEWQTRASEGLVHYPFLYSFASIKYALSKDQKPVLLNFGYDPIAMFGDVKVMKNKYALPLGFTYEKYISLRDFKILVQPLKMQALYKAVVIDDNIYKNLGNLGQLKLNDILLNDSEKEHSDDIKLLNKDTLIISKHGQNEIKGEINVDKDKMLFFSIPFDKGWNVKVDGKRIPAMMVNIGFIGIPIEKGLHQIELSYTPLYFNLGAAISFIAIILFIILISFKYRRDRKIRANRQHVR